MFSDFVDIIPIKDSMNVITFPQKVVDLPISRNLCKQTDSPAFTTNFALTKSHKHYVFKHLMHVEIAQEEMMHGNEALRTYLTNLYLFFRKFEYSFGYSLAKLLGNLTANNGIRSSILPVAQCCIIENSDMTCLNSCISATQRDSRDLQE